MTTELSTARGSAARSAAVARRLVTFAMTATMLSLTGCGDSGDDSETDASHTSCRGRNQIELMCRACADVDGRRLVNPMLITSLPPSPPYRCATQGFDEPDDDQAPPLRPNAGAVPDQRDHLY